DPHSPRASRGRRSRGRRDGRPTRSPADGPRDRGARAMSDRPGDRPSQGPAEKGARDHARVERRDLDKERGEPLAGGGPRGAPRALRRTAKPLRDWTTKPRILITNDDGIESRGLLALKQALDPIGETFTVAPDTNQSTVGHQKTLMRPLRVRERELGDGSIGWT